MNKEYHIVLSPEQRELLCTILQLAQEQHEENDYLYLPNAIKDLRYHIGCEIEP